MCEWDSLKSDTPYIENKGNGNSSLGGSSWHYVGDKKTDDDDKRQADQELIKGYNDREAE